MDYMYERGVVEVKISIYRKEKERKSAALFLHPHPQIPHTTRTLPPL